MCRDRSRPVGATRRDCGDTDVRPRPRYHDPIVAVFLNEATRKSATIAALANPAWSRAVRLRTRHVDDMLERQMALGCRQVVLLGAGLARLVGVLREVRDRIPRATICLDYLARDLVEKTTGDPALSVLAFRSETLCMPWTTGIADVRELARYLDCALLDDISIAELHRRHWPNQALGTALLSYHAVCTLASRAVVPGA